MLYDESKLTPDLKNYVNQNGGFLKKKSPNLPIKVKVHVYIIKASILNPIHLDSKFNPIITAEYGEQRLPEEKIKNDSIEPLIGKFFQFEAKFPCESLLTISIINKNILNANELIGHTLIDLEDRFYSDCYATCGLAKKFELTGYNAWRDTLYPKQILTKFCKKFGLIHQFINHKLLLYHSNGDQIYVGSLKENTATDQPDDSSSSDKTSDKNSNSEESAIESDDSKNQETKRLTSSNKIKEKKINEKQLQEEQLALDALNDWKRITKEQLVPEHVETRSLYNFEITELEQGKIQMWIDMFPINENQKEPLVKLVDVGVRKPKKYQLRIIVYNTKEVILDDYNPVTGEKSSDIYIKGFLCDQIYQTQKTDVHYRSLDGEGNFNWRFIFDFDYLPAEQCIVYTRKAKFGFTSYERKMKPILNLQCYDADQLSADDHLGSLELNLVSLIKGSRTPEACTVKMLKRSKLPRINLFKTKYHRGWYPFKSEIQEEAGKIELEFKLLTEKEAEEHPAGLGLN